MWIVELDRSRVYRVEGVTPAQFRAMDDEQLLLCFWDKKDAEQSAAYHNRLAADDLRRRLKAIEEPGEDRSVAARVAQFRNGPAPQA